MKYFNSLLCVKLHVIRTVHTRTTITTYYSTRYIDATKLRHHVVCLLNLLSFILKEIVNLLALVFDELL
jgi:hypothetical protein